MAKKAPDVISYNLKIYVEPGRAQEEYEDILIDIAQTLLGRLGRNDLEDHGDHYRLIRHKSLVTDGRRR